MVLLPEGVQNRIHVYLDSKGLKGEDVPKVMGTFILAKYATWAMILPACIRFQPLSRLFRRTYAPLRERMRVRIQKEVQLTEGVDSRYARRVQSWQLRRRKFQNLRSNALANMRQRLHRRQNAARSLGAYERAGLWYRSFSEKYADKFASSRFWGSFAGLLAQEPRKLAVGMAEGLILCKLLFPIYGTLEFYWIVRYYQQQQSQQGVTLDELFDVQEFLDDEDDEGRAKVHTE